MNDSEMNDSDKMRGAVGTLAPLFVGDHRRLTDAGWSYRTNEERGWIVYRNPSTGKWYSRKDAIVILDESSPGFLVATAISR
jgi:hypothetical protein